MRTRRRQAPRKLYNKRHGSQPSAKWLRKVSGKEGPLPCNRCLENGFVFSTKLLDVVLVGTGEMGVPIRNGGRREARQGHSSEVSH